VEEEHDTLLIEPRNRGALRVDQDDPFHSPKRGREPTVATWWEPTPTHTVVEAQLTPLSVGLFPGLGVYSNVHALGLQLAPKVDELRSPVLYVPTASHSGAGTAVHPTALNPSPGRGVVGFGVC
jgi:hypothetical protein